jgi:hypothetical protein
MDFNALIGVIYPKFNNKRHHIILDIMSFIKR